MPDPSPDRAVSLHTQLLLAHAALRDQLADLTDHLDDLDAGRTPPSTDLRLHCLAFCAALEGHHTGEDGLVFPLLAQRFPELEPVLVDLRADHGVVSHVLGQVENLVQGLADDHAQPLPEVREHLEGLTAVLETHFRYEERRIASALDDLGDVSRGATP